MVSRWSGACVKPDQFRVSVGPYAQRSINGCGAHSAPRQISRSTVVTGLAGSLALLPLAWAQGSATRRRVPRLPAANPPYDGTVPGAGDPIRVIGIGESSVSGVGLSRGDETVTAVTARALARHTGRAAAWRACGLSGATVRDALQRLVPSIAPEPADLMIVAFGVNDATSYRSPSAFADDLTELVTAARDRVGDAAVVIGGRRPPPGLSGAALAAAKHPRLALYRAAGSGRSAHGTAVEGGRRALFCSVERGLVRPRRVSPKFPGALDLG